MKRMIPIAVLLGGVLATGLRAEDKPAADTRKTKTFNVIVTDKANRPIAGAEVKPCGLRVKEFTVGWTPRVYGAPPIAVTNQDGLAVLEYPEQFHLWAKLLTTEAVEFEVRHPEFIRRTADYTLGPPRVKVRMTPGCEVRVTAINEETREPIQGFGVIVAGATPPESWVDAEGGGRRTRAIPEGRWQTMVVKPQADGPTLFSEVLPVPAKQQRALHLKNIWLSPGAVLRGTLSPNVPRPVSGYVIAEAVPSPAEQYNHTVNPSLIWYDWVEIGEDGSFEFESLPRGGQVHLMAFCDGWITETNPDLEGADNFKMGQLFELDDQVVEAELKMEPTGSLEVKLLAPDGSPLTDGDISSWPAQGRYKGQGRSLGQRIRSIHIIENQFLPPDKRLEPEDYYFDFPYKSPVNRDGVTTLQGLPLNFPLRLNLMHDRLEFQNADRILNLTSVQYRLQSPEPRQMTLKTVVRKPEKPNAEPAAP